MAIRTRQVERAFELAKERYAELGRRRRSGARPPRRGRRSRCTAGRGTTSAASRTRARRSAAGWPSPATIPGKARTADELRADLDKALVADPRHATGSTCTPATPRPAAGGSSATSCGPSISAAGSTGPRRSGMGMDFNPTFFAHPKAADGFTLAHPDDGDPPVLDRARHRLPADRRGHRRGAGHARASPTSGSPTAPRTRPSTARARASGWPRSLDAIFAEPLDPRLQPRRGRGQAVRHRVGELRRRLARVLPRLRRRPARSCSASTPATSTRPSRSPTRSRPCSTCLDEVLLHVSRGVRWDSDHVVTLDRRAAGDRPGSRPRRLPRPGPHRPRLLRRQHQPRRRLGDRHAEHAQGAADRAARADRPAPRGARPRATTRPGWRCWRSSRRCRSARSGITTAWRQDVPVGPDWLDGGPGVRARRPARDGESLRGAGA